MKNNFIYTPCKEYLEGVALNLRFEEFSFSNVHMEHLAPFLLTWRSRLTLWDLLATQLRLVLVPCSNWFYFVLNC